MIYEVTVTLRVEAEDEIDVEIAIDGALDLVSHIDPAYDVKWTTFFPFFVFKRSCELTRSQKV